MKAFARLTGLAVACLIASRAAFADELPFSAYVEAGDTLYVSGHLPLIPGSRELAPDDIGSQTHQVLRNIEHTLSEAGASLADIVSVTAFLTSMDDYAAFNAAYVEHFPGRKPARTTVAAKALAFGARIELNCIAVRGASAQAANPQGDGE